MSTLAEALEDAVRTGRAAPSAVVTDEERRELANIERWLANGTEIERTTVWWLLSLAQRLAGHPTRNPQEGRTDERCSR